MSVEPYSISLVNRFAVPSTQQTLPGYFRSKLFMTTSATNPLIAAAGPLFSLLERLSVSPTLPPIENIRANIEHELYAFQSKLISLQYAGEFITIAHYLLTATIDEIVGKNYIRLYNKAPEFKAFTPSSNDEEGPQQRFFKIVNYIKERTNQYLDLLELTYYCLIIGFEGEYHFRADGRQTLDNLIEELHQLIQEHRANKPHKLFKENPSLDPEPLDNKPLFAITFLAISLMASIYFGCHTLLEHKAKTLLSHNSLLANMDN